ncbi:MAG: ATP-binding protein [Clostridiales Family XIII bacterium]|jgi:predicted AAA+ superfamily ATPase|nr:ATP-binding protein [Clostridiales Family XIII bacterium]
MDKLIPRPYFLNNLIRFREADVIKVVTGVRRSGKSTLFELYIEYLKSEGVDESRIIHVNLEDIGMEHLHGYKALHDFLISKLHSGKMTYIFIDEVGRCAEFEKAVDSIYIRKNTDVYITGSNADLLSGELATLLSGRYIEIKMLPFSFAEFYEANKNEDKNAAFMDYLNIGSFPVVVTRLGSDMELADQYLEGIYNTIIIKDVASRKGIGDVGLLKNIVKYLCGNIGSPISTANITGYINSTGRKITQKTVDKYVKALEDSFLFYSVDRYDIKGKNLLKTLGKYYIVDTGLRNHLLSSSNSDVGHQIENIVFLELVRRGYRVNVGKAGDKEIDFVATKQNAREYYQVSISALDESVSERELAPLRKVGDNYPKYLLTLDFITSDYDGIKQINLIDWLLE